MFCLQSIQDALQEEHSGVLGWIFTNFAHRDSLTDSLLSLDIKTVSSRRWVYIVPAKGSALKIVHSIEQNILDKLPGAVRTYTGQAELKQILTDYVNTRSRKPDQQKKTFAILSDPDIAVISTLDAGFADLLRLCGIELISAASLIQRTRGLLSKAGIASHERSAALLYRIVQETWDFIQARFATKLPLYESEIQNFILSKFTDYSLVTDHPPIVAFGKNSGNPHYETKQGDAKGAAAQKGDIIQLDLWAKESFAADAGGAISPDFAVYSDISWVGVYDTQVAKNYADDFAKLIAARDTVYALLKAAAPINQTGNIYTITGSELDAAVRKSLIDAGYKNQIRHRTGHGIDTACHGSGVNLDSIEFPDKRSLLEGSCFSVEPGIYGSEYGMRTEIDIYIQDGQAHISGKRFAKENKLPIPQTELLYVKLKDRPC